MFSPPARPTHRAPGRAVVNYRAIAAPVGRSVGGVAVLGAVTATGSLVAIPEAEAVTTTQLAGATGAAAIVPTGLTALQQQELDTYTALVLAPGAKGDAVSYLQARLNDRGAKIAVDGSYGPATRKAVEAVQTNAGITVNGTVGATTWDVLVNSSAAEAPAYLTTTTSATSTATTTSDEEKYASQVLRYGDRGQAVSYLQARLNDRGAGIAVDGRFGPATRTAVKTLQTNGKVANNGVVGPATWNILFNTSASEVPATSASTSTGSSSSGGSSSGSSSSSAIGTVLRYGDTGSAVTYLQARLNDRGADIPEDGRFGPATRTAVKALQTNGGVSSDGVVGPATWNILVNTSADDVPAYIEEVEAVWDGDSMVALAKEQLGTPYVWGGSNPKTGLDCSGLVKYVYNAHGITVPRTAKNQTYGGRIISQSEAQPGDLVAFSAGNWGHIGIYAGNGKIIDASNSRGKVVYRDIWNSPHVFVTYR